MDVWSIITPIITAIAGAIGGAVGKQYLQPLLPKREVKISDKEMLKAWHDDVFKRQTFEGKFDDETIGHRVRHTDWFEIGIDETIRALKTGDCMYRGTTKKRTKGLDYINDNAIKSTAREVIKRLEIIRQIMKTYHHDPDGLRKYSNIIDEERDNVFNLLNPLWKKNGLEPLDLPSHVTLPKFK